MLRTRRIGSIATWLVIALVSGCAGAPGERAPVNPPGADPVIAVVASLFDAMRDGDASAIEAVVAPEVHIIVADAQGGVTVSTLRREAWAERLAGPPGAFDERMWAPEVRIDGDLATLWAPYSFRRNGELSHCGYDAFQLVRLDGRWRIVTVAYTRTTEDCDRFEPSSPPPPDGSATVTTHALQEEEPPPLNERTR